MPASKRTPAKPEDEASAEPADEKSAPIEIRTEHLPPAEVDLPKVIISRVLRDRIRRGVYPPGSKLPSIADIMEMSGAAKNTVRAAVDILSNDGYVRVIVGLGTFITAPESWPSQ
jgi:GntR family transcriptional regulator